VHADRPFRQSLERPGGIVSGLTMMGAADVAMWLAIMTLRGMDEHWVTSDMKNGIPEERARRRHLVLRARAQAGQANDVRDRGVPQAKPAGVDRAPCAHRMRAVEA
jgi:hypothetical protein